MDHSSHDHHHMMDHSSHDGMDHGDGSDSGHMCSMNMLFTWSTDNLCIVFRQWQITSTMSLIISLIAIVAICAGYEAVREGIRQYEAAMSKRAETAPPPRSSPPPSEESVTESTPFLALRTGQTRDEVTRRAHVIKAVLYGVQNFYAFMIMLIFMTYNGWVMIAVSVGAGLGYLLFGGRTPATKETACH